jgi:hypothetical protein
MEPKPPKKNNLHPHADSHAPATMPMSGYRPTARADATPKRTDNAPAVQPMKTLLLSSSVWDAPSLPQKPLAQEPPPPVAPSNRPPRFVTPGKLFRETPIPKKTPKTAEDSLHPTEIELPVRPVSRKKEADARARRPDGGRKRRLRSVRYAVLIAVSLGALGLFVLSLRKSDPPRSTAAVRASRNQIAETALPPIAPAIDQKSNQTENSGLPSVSPVNNAAVDLPKEVEPALDPLSARRAVDLLIAGRTDQALALYSALAQRQPEQPAYSAIAKILKRRAQQRCKQGSASGDQLCN